MNTMWFSLTAVGLGAVWYAALLPFAKAETLGGPLWFLNLSAMCLASLSVATLFHGQIVGARGRMFHALAIGLPTVGAFLFGVYTVVGWMLWNSTQPGLITRLDHDSIKIPFLFVLFGAWGLFFIAVPMGYVSQWLLQKVAGLGR